MSYIINEGIAPTIQLDSVGIGLQHDSIGNAMNVDNLDLNNDEYLVVGEKNFQLGQGPDHDMKNTKWSFLINQQGVAINTSRSASSNFLTPDTSLFVDDNIHCTGIIKAAGLELNNITLDSDPLTSSLIRDFIISANNISVNQPFQTGTHTNYEDVFEENYLVKNVFTTSFITLGGFVDTYENTHPLNIVSTANNKFNSMHVAIRNDTNNGEESCKFAIGIIGGSNISPAIISTTKGTPLEFHVSKSSSVIDDIYGDSAVPNYTSDRPEQFPAMAIDDKNNVAIGINKTSSKEYKKKTLFDGNVTTAVINEYVKLEVKGTSCFDDVLVYDYDTKSHKSLDEIYIRKIGTGVINSTQIEEGDFLGGHYNFNNITVNDVLSAKDFNVLNNVNIQNELKTDKLQVVDVANFSGVVQFENSVYFNNSEQVSIRKLKVSDDIFIGNKKIIPIDIDDPSTGFGTYSRNEDGSNFFFTYVHSNIATLDANCNISFPKKMAIGLTENDSFEGVLNVIKSDDSTSNNFDITLKSKIMNKNYYANIGRLSRLDTIDNSLIINTNKVENRENNIYFYPETNMSELTSNYFLPNIKNTPPILSLKKGSVSINKLAARQGFELDINGKTTANEYHMTIGNEMHKIGSFISQQKNYFNLSDYSTDKFCINYNTVTANATNMKGLNVKKGINADEYYKNDKIIETLQNANEPNEFYTNKKISIGWQGEDIKVPLQIRNLTTEDYNYSVIRIYRGIRGGGLKNNSDYSGIDFCEYDRDLNSDRNAERWFLYKNHTHNDVDSRNVKRVGPLQIGYIDKDIKPSTYGMSFYYNTTNSKYHIDVNNPDVSHIDNDAAMSIYGDLEVHGDIKILDYNGCNFNFKLQNISSLLEITKYIKTVETYGDIMSDDQLSEYESNDITYIGHNLIYRPGKSVIVDSVFNSNIPFVVKQDNSNLATSKFITYADNSLECSSSIELAIYGSNLKISDDNFEKDSNINNMIKFNLSTNDAKTTNFDMSFFHKDIYERFYTFKNRLDEYDNIISSSTHVGMGKNIDNNSNIAFHIDDNSKFGLQITNDRSPSINLLHTGGSADIYHTMRGGSYDNNYRYSIDVANTSEYNEPNSKEVFIIDAFYDNKIRKGARFGFNDTELNESFAIKTDYDTNAMSITSRYSFGHIFDSKVTILPKNTQLLKEKDNWNDAEKSYSAIFNYNITDFPIIDDNNNPISEANKNDPTFTFATDVSLESNFSYKTIHSNLTISYNSSNLNYDTKSFNDPLVGVDTTQIDLVKTSLQYDTNIYNIEPEIILSNHDIISDDMVNSTHLIEFTITSNIDLINDIASNYEFNYVYKLISDIPDDIDCNITYYTNYSTAIDPVTNRNMIYISNIIYTDILPFDNDQYYLEYIDNNVIQESLGDNGLYNDVYLESETSNILRINSNLDFTGKFIAERDNFIKYKTSNILPISFVNPSSSENLIDYMYSTVIDENDNSNIYITTSNYVIYNNVNSIPRDTELEQISITPINFQDTFNILGNNITNQLYITEYFNKLEDTQEENYLIEIKNYNYKNYKPHITLKNEIDTIDIIEGHEIYSYDGNFEIKYVNSQTNSTWVPFKIDSDGNATIRGGISFSGDMNFDGKIYDSNGNDLIEILNNNYYKEYEINSSNIHFNSYGSNGLEINARVIENHDDYKFLYVRDFSDNETFDNVMVLHKPDSEYPTYKLDLYGDIDTSNGILRVEGRDIINDTCNYITQSSNYISKRITHLNTDNITEEPNSQKKFIIDNEYNNNLLVNGNLTINSNLIVLGEKSLLNTEVYTTEQIEVVNSDTDVALKVTQNGTTDIVNILNSSGNVFTISHNGNVGINNSSPFVSLDVNTTDGIKLPKGNTNERPTYLNGIQITDTSILENYVGNIRYNNQLGQFEGFGAGNQWGSLGGVKDVDGDTYISAESNAGSDNDELKFYTAAEARMTISNNGLIGIGTQSPNKLLSLNDEYATLSIHDSSENNFAQTSIELVNGNKNDFDKNELQCGWKISNSNNQYLITSGSNNIINDRFAIDGVSGNIGIGTEPHIYQSVVHQDEFKLNILGSLNIEGNIYKDGELFTVGNIIGSDAMGVASQNMTIQTLSETYTKTRIMSEEYNPLQNTIADNGWRFIDNDFDNGFVIKIKPSHRKSKILLNLSCHIGLDSSSDSRWWGLKLYRKIDSPDNDWTEVKAANGNYDNVNNDNGDSTTVGGSTACWISHNLGTSLSSYENFVANVSGIFCDSPDTDEYVYYTVKWKSKLGDTGVLSGYGDLYLNRPAIYNSSNSPVLSSSWVAQELWQLGTPFIPAYGYGVITMYNNNSINYVGIANTEPEYILDINGDIRASSNIYIDGKIGINTYTPEYSIDLQTSDGIRLPSGNNSERPTPSTVGVIRYNTENNEFEGYGSGNSWGSLGGIKDVDGDTYISAEDSPSFDNDALKFYTNSNIRMTIDKIGNIGIGTSNPYVSVDINTQDGLKIPSGNNANRPVNLVSSNFGIIRYNTQINQYEGYGVNDEWGSLGGIKDLNGDTYISAENSPNDNNDELKFYTKGNIHMIIDDIGNVGVGKEVPAFKIDVDGIVNASSFNIDGVPFRLEFPKGMALQTKHLTYTDTCTKNDTEIDWVPVDNDIVNGFVISVRPSHITSKILLNLVCHIGMDYLQDSKWWGLKLYRKIGQSGNWNEVVGANGTGTDNGSSCWISHNLGAESSNQSHSITNVTGSYEDEPQTTDDVYYTIYWKSRLDGTNGRLYLNKSAEAYDTNYPKPSSSWCASEIWNNGVPYIPTVSSSVISISGDNVGINMIPIINSSYKLEVIGDVKCNSLFHTSDKRYKKNVKSLENALNLIDFVNPVSYTTVDDNKFKYGFIAQELENIIPNVVNIPKDKNELYSIDYVSMIPLLTKSIQELSNIINFQQKEIDELKSKI